MRPTRLVLAAALAVVAAGLALFAADVHSWQETMRAGDLRFRLDSGAADWEAATVAPSAISRTALAVGDDRRLREAVAAFRGARRARGSFLRRHARSEAEAALAAAVADRDEPKQASQAADLAGVLAFADATTGQRAAPPVERSLAAFQNAVRLDHGNAAAKYNLELLLRLLEARGQRIGPNPSPGPRGSGQRGAGSGSPGRGY